MTRTGPLAIALAATAGLNADVSPSKATGLVFCAAMVPCAWLAVKAMRQAALDERDEHRAGRDLEPEGP